MSLDVLEAALIDAVAQRQGVQDPAHDALHAGRVARTAKRLCALEGGRLDIVLPAAWMHDWVALPKNHSDRARASTLCAEAATDWLAAAGYPAADRPAVAHAIAAHSFSAGIVPQTLEAAIVQDADRLDALGAIGIARCFSTAGSLGRVFYCQDDPFCDERLPDDTRFTVDHFFAKLLHIGDMLRTAAGREEGKRRQNFLRAYLDELRREITVNGSSTP